MTPLVIDGTMYVSDPGLFGVPEQNLFSIDAANGQLNWRRTIKLSKGLRDTELSGWRAHKGIAFGNGKLYMATYDARLHAFDAETGRPIRDFSDTSKKGKSRGFVTVADQDAGYYLTAAPIFISAELVPNGGPATGHDLVVIGIAGAENENRGFISAYDADDGDLLWRFFTVPSPGEFGGDTWPTNTGTVFEDPFTRGGGAPWMPPSYDPESGLLIFGTGNAGPDLDGTHREGDNLFTAAVVAVNIATGERVWHFQEVHHDLWDYDQPSPPIMFTMMLGNQGKEVKAVGAAGKTGWYYIFDRLTGELIHPCPERPVPTDTVIVAPDGSPEIVSPTQPFCVSDAFVPQGNRILPTGQFASPIFTPPGPPVAGNLENPIDLTFPPVPVSTIIAEPSILGGSEWSPLAHDPDLGLTFIPANIAPVALTAIPQETPNPGNFSLGGVWSFTIERIVLDWSGNLTAMDPSTGKIRWQRESDSPLYNGVCATAGGLVFMGEAFNQAGPGTPQWFLTAFKSDDGERLWSWEVPDNVGVSGACISYEIDGKQYIALSIGGTRLAIGNFGDTIYAFALPDQ